MTQALQIKRIQTEVKMFSEDPTEGIFASPV